MYWNYKMKKASDNQRETVIVETRVKNGMKLKKLIVFCILTCVSFGLWAQNSNLKRSVLFTLGENEIIKYNEYHLEFKTDKNLFTGFLLDTVTKKETFVFNGKRIQTVESLMDDWNISVHYCFPKQENGFVIAYTKAGKAYINIRGNIYGGYLGISNVLYDKHNNNFAFEYCVVENKDTVYYLNLNGEKKGAFEYAKILCKDATDNWVYEYLLGGYWYDNKSGKIKMSDKTGIQHIGNKYSVNNKGELLKKVNGYPYFAKNKKGDFVYSYEGEDEKIIINKNGEEIQTELNEISDLKLNEYGDCLIRNYNKNQINYDKNIGEFGYIDIFEGRYGHIFEDSCYIYNYRENGITYVKTMRNGKYNSFSFKDNEFLGFKNIEDGFVFYYEQNNKIYVNFNGKNIGNTISVPLLFKCPSVYTDGKDFIFTYMVYDSVNDRNRDFININGKETEYSRIFSSCCSGDVLFNKRGKHAYTYAKDGNTYLQINDKAILIAKEVVHITNFYIDDFDNFFVQYNFYVDGWAGGENMLNINGVKKTGSSCQIRNFEVAFTKDGQYAYVLCKKDKESKTVYINNDSLTCDCDRVSVHWNKYFGFFYGCYKDYKTYYHNIVLNGKKYDKVSGLQYDDDGYIFIYEENGTNFVNVNGSVSRLENQQTTGECYYSKGNYYYAYKEQGNENKTFFYAKINGKVYLKAKKFYNETKEKDGNPFYCIEYEENNTNCLNLNGKIFKNVGYVHNAIEYFNYQENDIMYKYDNGLIEKYLYDYNDIFSDFNPEKLQSSNGEHTFTSKLSSEYVVIDGQKVGKTPALRAWYDEIKNSFIWNALEGKELVIYEYKLK